MTTLTDSTPEPSSPDLLTVLTALRPHTDIDRLWDPRAQAAVRDRITAGHEPGPAATDELAARRRRRPLAVLALSGLVLAGGAGAAAAGGLVPQAFIDVFSGWQSVPVLDLPAVDPATAERVATVPGPDGTEFTVLSAHAADDPAYTCTVALFETQESAAGPATFTGTAASWCQDSPSTAPFGAGAGTEETDGRDVWWAPAGDAVRGELRAPDGGTRPVALVRGTFYGWTPAPVDGQPRAELVGYAADGTEVGRVPVGPVVGGTSVATRSPR
jgi:hypothetical protein